MRALLTLLLCSILNIAFPQNVINPYDNTAPGNYTLTGTCPGCATITDHNLAFGQISYNGEYQIEFGALGEWANQTWFKTVEIETVSFQITPENDCAFIGTGCVSTSPDRILAIPLNPYDPNLSCYSMIDDTTGSETSL